MLHAALLPLHCSLIYWYKFNVCSLNGWAWDYVHHVVRAYCNEMRHVLPDKCLIQGLQGQKHLSLICLYGVTWPKETYLITKRSL